MKITFFIGSMILKGGAERVLANLINDLKKDNDITLITIWKSKLSYDILDINIIYLDEEETTLNDLNKKKNILSEIKKIKNYYLRRKKYKSLDVVNNSDVIISFLPEASFISLACKKNVPVIISVRNDPKVEYKNIIKKILMKKLYKKSDGIVFQTQEAQDYFDNIISKEKTKCTIIPNPVNDIFIEKSYEGIRNKNIVGIGRLEEQKNFPLMIEAFNIFHKKHPDYTLSIYGNGSKKEELTKLINKLELNKVVTINNPVENIKEKMYKEAMFVLSSSYEGMPNALIEALCLGIPCISTDCPCGGPKFLIKNNENGILVKLDDKEEMANAMCKIVEDSSFSKKIGENGSKLSEKMNKNIINQKWLDFISDTIRR